MKALIDTHVFLWVITTPEKLSEKALQIIQSKANDIFLSPVSCWEIVIKYQVNKLDLSENLNSLILEQIKKSEIKILPITVEHTLNILNLPLIHKKRPAPGPVNPQRKNPAHPGRHGTAAISSRGTARF